MSPEKPKKTAVILFIDPKIAQLTQQTVEEMGHQCILVKETAEAKELLKKKAVDLLVWKIQDRAEDFALFDYAVKVLPRLPGIAIIDESLEDYFPELLLRAYPHNLIADNHPLDYRELTSTIKKLLSGDIFGMEKYGVSPTETIHLSSSGEKYDVIEKVRDYCLDKGVQDRIVRNIELILNELLMNAIFDAPVDGKGVKLYEHTDRGAVFDLKERERPIVQYGINEDRLAVSVSDLFGTFREDTFFSYVHRCFSEKSILEGVGKGAGMGLFMVFKSLNQLVINVAYNQKTEVIALIDYHSSMRELKKRRHSFHHFHLGNFNGKGELKP